jgi:predicted MFS family arabinose efflux permease
MSSKSTQRCARGYVKPVDHVNHAAQFIRVTRYQKQVVAILAFLQFTVILDFMILSPLGAMMMPALKIDTAQFGFVVSAYVFSAGASSFVTAAFADRFDRKRLLLVFYVGFIVGTALCGFAPSYELLVAARIVTGMFGGVIGAVCMAIVADLIPLENRGRVMGVIGTASAASQVLGIPVGLFLANQGGWHVPFLVIAGVGAVVGVVIGLVLQPIDAHLHARGGTATPEGPFVHVIGALTHPPYLRAFAATVLLATGGFMIMPFASPYIVANLRIPIEQLPLIYMVTGVGALFAGPLLGRLSDRVGKFLLFAVSSVFGAIVLFTFAHLGPSPIWLVMLVNVALFVSITGRMVSAQALLSAVPEMKDRGAFMSISASIGQLAGGISAVVAGSIVGQRSDGFIENFETLTYIVMGAMAVALVPMWVIERQVKAKRAAQA